MPRDFPRTRRIGQQIKREVAELIQTELKDPRVGLVTVTDVEVSPDYEHANVFFTSLNPPENAAATLAALNHSAGFLRSQIARRVKLYAVPQLHFVYDPSVEQGVRLSRLIDQALADDEEHKT